MKIEKSIHSNDCSYSLFSSRKTKKEYEKELDVSASLKALKSMGWHRSQWHIYTKADLKKYKHMTIFVEIFSDYYHGYLRADSRISLKHACNKALNKAMKFNMCEQKHGHIFEPIPTYDNGLLHCKKCGFWGYTSKFEQMNRETEHYKLYYHMAQENNAKYTEILRKYGIAFNGFGGLLIRDTLNGKNHSFILKEPITEECLQDIRKVLIKHKFLEKKKKGS